MYISHLFGTHGQRGKSSGSFCHRLSGEQGHGDRQHKSVYNIHKGFQWTNMWLVREKFIYLIYSMINNIIYFTFKNKIDDFFPYKDI